MPCPRCVYRAVDTVRSLQLPGCWWDFAELLDEACCLNKGAGARGKDRLRDRGGWGGSSPLWAWLERVGESGCQWWHCNSVHFIAVLWRILVLMKVPNTGCSSRRRNQIKEDERLEEFVGLFVNDPFSGFNVGQFFSNEGWVSNFLPKPIAKLEQANY